MNWQLVRLAVNAPNLYRWRGVTVAGWPAEVQHFNKCPATRRVLGRWSDCPNVNIRKRIARSALS